MYTYLYVQTPSVPDPRLPPVMDIGKDLVAAPATPPVPAILAEGQSHGCAIIKRVDELSGDGSAAEVLPASRGRRR